MGKDANTHTSIMLLAHPALITLQSVSFQSRDLYTGLSHDVISD